MKIPRFPKQHWTVTASGCLVVLWLITLVLWRVELENTSRFEILFDILYWLVFSATFIVATLWICFTHQQREHHRLRFSIVASVAVIFYWQFGVFIFDAYYFLELRAWTARTGLAIVFVVGLSNPLNAHQSFILLGQTNQAHTLGVPAEHGDLVRAGTHQRATIGD